MSEIPQEWLARTEMPVFSEEERQVGFVVSLDDEQRRVVAELWGDAFVAKIEAELTRRANAWLAEKES